MKIGMMATYPPRRESLRQTLTHILPQLDRLYIYCNRYGEDELTSLGRWVDDQAVGCYVKLIDPDYTEKDVKDMGKFWAMGTVKGYIFLLDDDLAYPANYCDRHVEAIEDHRQVSAVHGRRIKRFPLENYFGDTQSFHYRQPLKKPEVVDIAGTGTVAFATRHLPMSLFVTPRTMEIYKGMADIWFACLLSLYDINIICLPRQGGWLNDTPAAAGTSSLYKRTKENEQMHRKMINKLNWSLSRSRR